MQNVELTQLLVNLVKQIAQPNSTTALDFAQNPQGVLVSEGVTEHDLSQVDMPAVIAEACSAPDFPAEARGQLSGYTGGSGGGGGGGGSYTPPPAHTPSGMEGVVTHLTYVTQVTHQDNDVITTLIDNSHNIDQSTDIEVGGDFEGDIDIDNASASGDRAVAGGEGDVNAATGDGSQVIDDSTVGQNQNASPGAVQAGGDAEGVNTGINTGVVAGGDVDDTIVGNNNQQTNPDFDIDGDVEGVINFGDGDVNNVNDSTLNDANVGSGSNVSDNELEDGSAIGTGAGDVRGESNDVTEVSTVVADDSIVTTEQGPGDQEVEFEHEVHADVMPPKYEDMPREITDEAPETEDAPA